MEQDQPPGGAWRYRKAVELAVLLSVGAAISGLATEAALATARLDWRVDAVVVAMTAMVFAPLGIACLGSARLFLFPPRSGWSLGRLLWFATSLVELAWCGVFLDSGVRLGRPGRFICGVTALLGSPAVAGAAAALAVATFATHAWRRDFWQWGGILLGLVVGLGWGAFLWVLLPLRF